MLNKISQWLGNDNRNYKEGVEIYLRIRKDRKFDQFFQQKDDYLKTDFHFQQLHKEIHRLARIHHADIAKVAFKLIEVKKTPFPPKKEKAKDRPVIFDHPDIDFRELPDELKLLYKENKEVLYPDQRKKHYEMKNTAISDDQRQVLANDVVKIDAKIRENWEKIDTWNTDRNSGQNITKNTALEIVQINKDISNCENYIRRYRSNVAKATTEKSKAKMQAHLDKFTAELAKLKNTLEELTK